MIRQIRLVNCQSLRDCTFNLATDRLNVIVAPNGTGKSVLFKMLKITASPTFFNARKRKKLIRWNAECAIILFAFDDGALGYTKVFPTKVIYGYKKADQDFWENFVEPPKILLDSVGLLVNAEGKFVANIIDTDQNLLLVDSDSKSNVELMKLLISNQDLNNLRERTENAIKISREAEVRVTDRLSDIAQQLDGIEYTDLDKMEKNLNQLTVARDKMYDLIKVYHNCDSFSGVLKKAKDFTFLLSLCELTSLVEQLTFSDVQEVTFKQENLKACELLELIERLNFHDLYVPLEPVDMQIVDVLESIEKIRLDEITIQSFVDFEVAIQTTSFLDKLESLHSLLLSYKNCINELGDLQEKIRQYEADFLKSGDVHHCEIYGEVVWDGQNCVPSRF